MVDGRALSKSATFWTLKTSGRRRPRFSFVRLFWEPVTPTPCDKPSTWIVHSPGSVALKPNRQAQLSALKRIRFHRSSIWTQSNRQSFITLKAGSPSFLNSMPTVDDAGPSEAAALRRSRSSWVTDPISKIILQLAL
jgi:hypothetical protein